MAYTPINWQTGDTITAEKLNKMDNGWGIQNTQLFSETVTTASSGQLARGRLTYSTPIDADTLEVTFNGTTYVCQRTKVDDAYAYGGIGATGPDFTNYPFALMTDYSIHTLYTETAGTYTVSASMEVLQTSDSFKTAVKSLLPPIVYVENGVTTWQEVTDAISGGKVVIANGNGKSLLVSSTEYTSHGDYVCYAVGADSSGVVRVNSSSAASADSPVAFAS